ncbi:MAG: calcium/sodium antiporter [Dehalococcoidia bacterium]
MLDLVAVVVGLILLLVGAWLVVRSGVRLAVMWGVSRVVIGATIVGFGTSAPEFVVSLIAALRDSPGIAIGNVLGSNVANVALVLGVSALIAPLSVDFRLLRWEIPVLAAATAGVIVLAQNGSLGQVEGLVLFGGLVAFVVLSPRLFPELTAAFEAEEEAEEEAERLSPPLPRDPRLVIYEFAWLSAGIAGLTLGASFAVEGGVAIAQRAGLSEIAIGATIVAIGTSLPELATSIVAAFRREHEIAVANVVGSNIFNLLGVLGLTAAIAGLPIDGDLYHFELPALAASTLVLVPLAWPRYRIGRADGAALISIYVLFTVATLRWT